MYDSTREKLQRIAVVLAVIGIAISVIVGIAIASTSNKYNSTPIWIGLAVAVSGSLTSWISNLLLAALGELVDSSTQASMTLNKIYKTINQNENQGKNTGTKNDVNPTKKYIENVKTTGQPHKDPHDFDDNEMSFRGKCSFCNKEDMLVSAVFKSNAGALRVQVCRNCFRNNNCELDMKNDAGN
ncbi:MAG: hypothetical protein IJU01_00070 [Lachnospiraceae bacterium]|nr:hypothetical protein [Lachnospiraceae bacterium]